MTPEQLFKARSLLEWTVQRLAGEASIGPEIIKSIEAKSSHLDEAAHQRFVRVLRETLEAAGIKFLGDAPADVRFADPSASFRSDMPRIRLTFALHHRDGRAFAEIEAERQPSDGAPDIIERGGRTYVRDASLDGPSGLPDVPDVPAYRETINILHARL